MEDLIGKEKYKFLRKLDVADLIARPEKSHKIYKAWKKSRTFDGPIEHKES